MSKRGRDKKVACSHCGDKLATYEWNIAICADGRRKRPRVLCCTCDAVLNRFVLDYFNFKNVDEVMKRYVGEDELWGKPSASAIY